MNNFKKFFYHMFFPPKIKSTSHSIYALMENGSMRKGSIGVDIFKRLMLAYNTEYDDVNDKDAIFSAISANYEIEAKAAWIAFLAEIGHDD